MIFRAVGNKELPVIILLHGGGLSDWSWREIVDQLSVNYNVILAIIDGHGVASHETFVSIEDSASKLIHYITKEHGGKVFALGGLSIGAQIVCEVLSQQSNIADYAIVESALVYPIKGITALTIPMYQLCYGLVKKRWFSKMQAKTLSIPDNLFETYYQDSLKMSKQSLINITLSNGNYSLKQSIENTSAKVLLIVGEKELSIMKQSAQLLHQTISGSVLYTAPKMKHGELSIVHKEKYIQLLRGFLAK